MSDPALLHVHNCYLTVEDHLNKKNIPSAYTHLRRKYAIINTNASSNTVAALNITLLS